MLRGSAILLIVFNVDKRSHNFCLHESYYRGIRHFDQSRITPREYVHLVNNLHYKHFVAVQHHCFYCSVHPSMDTMSTDPFSIEWNETKIATETIKWTLGACQRRNET
jgi:hypothetical protein